MPDQPSRNGGHDVIATSLPSESPDGNRMVSELPSLSPAHARSTRTGNDGAPHAARPEGAAWVQRAAPALVGAAYRQFSAVEVMAAEAARRLPARPEAAVASKRRERQARHRTRNGVHHTRHRAILRHASQNRGCANLRHTSLVPRPA
jgi:hypothetical protein